MKSDIAIKDDLYNYIKGSALESVVTGEIRKTGKRSKGSESEDIVLSVPGNRNGQIQEAVVYVNIYVKDDIKEDGDHQEATIRLRTLCAIASETLEVGSGSTFRFTLESQSVIAVDATQEHVISNKLIYKQVNE